MDFFEMIRLVGVRLKVRSLDGNVDLGLGTYVYWDIILLDTGKKIMGKDCQWTGVPDAPKAPEIKVKIVRPVLVFVGGRQLQQDEHRLSAGQEVIIKEMVRRSWNHGTYLAGRFNFGRADAYLMMTDLDYPEEKPPHLRVA